MSPENMTSDNSSLDHTDGSLPGDNELEFRHLGPGNILCNVLDIFRVVILSLEDETVSPDSMISYNSSLDHTKRFSTKRY